LEQVAVASTDSTDLSQMQLPVELMNSEVRCAGEE
jgi:hypothetical protein